ncbi:hypothetical protein L208DRAFT_363234 [Tricholoma matsutake]|nr:hypothetical protein L208DRAFT_363234 [Tricholoma matsutake 945]
MLRTLCYYQSVCLIILLVLLSLVAIANATQSWFPDYYNVTIPNTSSQVVYTPSLCNSSIAICSGAWQILDLNGTTVVSTNGPDPAQGSIIPQMFFQARARDIYIYPFNLSNATANITVTTNQSSISTNFNSSVGVIAILNLLESQTTVVALTFVPSFSASRLDIGSLILTVPTKYVTLISSVINPNNQIDPLYSTTATSVILPTVTLPPSMTLSFPAPISTSTSTASHTWSNHQLVADAVGIVLGLGFGLTAIAVVGYVCWRRRRLKNSDVSSQRGVCHEKRQVRT